ncbi:hypothetical protein [Terrabacter sp. NPDC080008]|uniref:hypothetical protein n=1 Tax=Terrabacter sp. NPDC080008 TaxID=3155176 RepID=UPI00344CF568
MPIIVIYRKYYGAKAAMRITGTFYLAMVLAGYVVELVFTPLGLIPQERNASVVSSSITWNYTTWLNIVMLVLAAVLLVRFVRTGGVPMLRMMGGSPDDGDSEHAGHEQAGREDEAPEPAGGRRSSEEASG